MSTRPQPVSRGAGSGAALGRALLAASQLSLGERLHLLIRHRSVPWEPILDALDLGELGPSARLADLGAGPGLLAFLLEQRGFAGHYLGIDPDPVKVDRARRWLAESERRRFVTGGAERLDDALTTTGVAGVAGLERVALIDVLYLVPPDERVPLLRGLHGRLRPGGLLVATTSGDGPAWKQRLDLWQERLAVGVLGLTRGALIAPLDGRALLGVCQQAGFVGCELRPIGAGYLHGFALVLARSRGMMPGHGEPTEPGRIAAR